MSNKLPRVAELLEWRRISTMYPYYELPNGYAFDGDNEDDLVIATAFAKAEMAKRGWLKSQCGVLCTGSYPTLIDFVLLHYSGRETSIHKYDPRDPISEATAMLEAAIEALEGQQWDKTQ